MITILYSNSPSCWNESCLHTWLVVQMIMKKAIIRSNDSMDIDCFFVCHIHNKYVTFTLFLYDRRRIDKYRIVVWHHTKLRFTEKMNFAFYVLQFCVTYHWKEHDETNWLGPVFFSYIQLCNGWRRSQFCHFSLCNLIWIFRWVQIVHNFHSQLRARRSSR